MVARSCVHRLSLECAGSCVCRGGRSFTALPPCLAPMPCRFFVCWFLPLQPSVCPAIRQLETPKPQSPLALKPALVMLSLLMAALIWGHWRLANAPQQNVAGVRLRLVQPNIEQVDKWKPENAAARFIKTMLETDRPENKKRAARPSRCHPCDLARISPALFHGALQRGAGRDRPGVARSRHPHHRRHAHQNRHKHKFGSAPSITACLCSMAQQKSPGPLIKNISCPLANICPTSLFWKKLACANSPRFAAALKLERTTG